MSNRRIKCMDALRKYGPMSMTDIADKTGLKRTQISGAISESRRHRGTDEFIIVGYESRTLSGQHSDPKIYGLGPGKDFGAPNTNPDRSRMGDRNLCPFERIFGKR